MRAYFCSSVVLADRDRCIVNGGERKLAETEYLGNIANFDRVQFRHMRHTR
jgi:hypothetical protein